jgi:uncharacterized membrane protein
VAGPVRSGLKIALDEHPEIKAILMGTRRSDPHAANLQAFQVTIASRELRLFILFVVLLLLYPFFYFIISIRFFFVCEFLIEKDWNLAAY